MNRKFTDENIDQLLRSLVNDAASDDVTVDQIADSPQLWWGIQRKIKSEERPVSMWNGVLRRWLMIGTPLTVAALLLFVLFSSKPSDKPVEQVTITPAQKPNELVNKGPENESVEIPSPEIMTAKSTETAKRPANLVAKALVDKKKPRPHQSKPDATLAKSEPREVKSEFIALSYARNPDSGQIVRVKVPSSMMVSLGLVASVEKPTNLVNAELLVGDDGTTHAIRFIR